MRRFASVIAFGLAMLALPLASYGEPKWGRICTDCHTPTATGRFGLLNPTTYANPVERPGAPDYGTLPVFQVSPGQAADLQMYLVWAVTGDGYAAKIDGFDSPGVVAGASLVPATPLFGTDCNWSRWLDYVYVDPFEQYTWPYGPTIFSFYCSTSSAVVPDYYPLRFALVGRDETTGELFYEELRFYLQVVGPAQPGIPGDLNCDGVVNAADIVDFALALLDPVAYAASHNGNPNPPCDYRLADMNGDQAVNGLDVQAFIANIDNWSAPVNDMSCIVCHSQPQRPWPAVVNADGSGGHHLASVKQTDVDCKVCHDVTRHRNGEIRIWGNPVSADQPFVVVGDPNQLTPFCTVCHTGTNAPTVHATGAAWQPACAECHTMHNPAGANLALVPNTIYNQTLDSNSPVVFTSRTGPGSFSDGVGANDGVCQVCHTATSHHRYDGSGTAHREGSDCSTCHTHKTGFQSVTSCLACHNTAQGSRRAVVSEFGKASHHVRGASVTDADCQVCHDVSLHMNGSVRLKNADAPATVVTLLGSPFTSFTEAKKLEPFCLACHDANGASGSAPFSNNIMPTAIDAAKWASSSHALATPQTTCMGDGETFGCHSSGHGSVKTKLQAPGSGGQPAVSGDPLRQEEGMCYSCHDGSPASNVQATFAMASHHKVSAVDQTTGARLECKSCHNPHTDSPTRKVINPDTGAPWTGTMEGFCLTCHDGTPPTGVAFPAATGTGFNKASFVNSIHDSSTGTDSCRHCHTHHGSTEPSLMLARYVTTDSTYTSTTGTTNYALCCACHPLSILLGAGISFSGSDGHNKSAHRRSCIICHDAHRSFDAGEAGLIDWDYPVRRGTYQVTFPSGRNGSNSFTPGSCYITCHGQGHSPETYSRYTANNLVSTVPNTGNCRVCHINGVLIPP